MEQQADKIETGAIQKFAGAVTGAVVNMAAGMASIGVAAAGEHFVAAEVAELSGKAVETRVGRCTLIDPEAVSYTHLREPEGI